MWIHILGLVLTLIIVKQVVVIDSQNEVPSIAIYKKSMMLLSVIPFTFISGVRYFVGTDWKMYRNVFLQVNKGRKFNSLYLEKGYLLLNKIVGLFTNNYTVFFTVVALIITICWFISIYYLSDNPVMSVFLWVMSQFYFFSFNGMRQAIAISLLYLGLLFLYKKRVLAYLIISIIAVTMHRSAIIMVPLIFFANIKMKFSRYIAVLISACILGRFSVQIVNNYSFFAKYRMYLKIRNDFSISDFVILLTIWIFAVSIKRHADMNNNEKFNLFYNILFFSLILCVFTAFIPYVYRFLLYFKYISILLVPEICKEYKYNVTCTTIRGVTYMLYGVQILYYAIIMHYNEYLNYAWVLGR